MDASSPRGASRLLAEVLRTCQGAGVSGLVMVRAHSAYYIHDIVATASRAGADSHHRPEHRHREQVDRRHP